MSMLLERDEKLTLYFISSVLKILNLPVSLKTYLAKHWNAESDKIFFNHVLRINLGHLSYFSKTISVWILKNS
jgi:hypothetical protein